MRNLKPTYHLLLFFCSFLYFNFSFGQDLEFVVIFGTEFNEQGWEVLELPDSSFIVGSSRRNLSGGAGSDFLVIKTNSIGQLIWEKTYDLSDDLDQLKGLTQTDDEGFLLVGSSKNNDFNYLIIKIDSDGNFEWMKESEEAGNELLVDAAQIGDFYFFAGYESIEVGDPYDIFLIKTDLNGEVVWKKKFGGPEDDYVFDMLATSNDKIVLAGRYNIDNESDYYMLVLDLDGEISLYNLYGGPGTSQSFQSVAEFENGDLIFSGYSNLDVVGTEKYLTVTKTDPYGGIYWSKSYQGNNFINGAGIDATVDNGFIVTGNKTVQSDANVYLLKCDENGVEEWQTEFGAEGLDYGLAVQQTMDQGFIISGTTASSTPNGDEDIYLIKIGNSNPLDADDYNNKITANIYPKPFSSNLVIEIENPNFEIFEMNLIDQLGRVVYQDSIDIGKRAVDLSFLVAGAYILQLKNK